MSLGNFENCIHVSHLTVEVDGNNRCDRAACAAGNGLSSARVGVALCLEVFAKLLRIHVVGAFVDIDEFRQGACLGYGFCGGNERVRNRDHAITRRNSGRHQAEAHGIGSAGETHAMLNATKEREILFKAFYRRAADETGSAKCVSENIDELFFKFDVWSNQIQKRNLISHDYAILTSVST